MNFFLIFAFYGYWWECTLMIFSLILIFIQRSLQAFTPLRTKCVQSHRRFTLYACQFLNERELAVLPPRHSHFLLCIETVFCLRGKSHSFCTIKSSRETETEFCPMTAFLSKRSISCETKAVLSRFSLLYCLWLFSCRYILCRYTCSR